MLRCYCKQYRCFSTFFGKYSFSNLNRPNEASSQHRKECWFIFSVRLLNFKSRKTYTFLQWKIICNKFNSSPKWSYYGAIMFLMYISISQVFFNIVFLLSETCLRRLWLFCSDTRCRRHWRPWSTCGSRHPHLELWKIYKRMRLWMDEKR